MAFGLCYPDEQWLNAVEKLIKGTSISKHHAVGDAVHDCVTCPYPSAADLWYRYLYYHLSLWCHIMLTIVQWRMIQLQCIALDTSCTQHWLMKNSKDYLKYVIFNCHLHCGDVTWLHKVICSLICFCSGHSRQWCCRRQPVSAVGWSWGTNKTGLPDWV